MRTFTGAAGILTYTPTALPAGVYYWHVRALNTSGVAGPWSEARSFTIDITPPAAPALSKPANAAGVIGTPAFIWLASATSVIYQFQYGNNANFVSPTYTSAELAALNHTPPAIPYGIYFWRARAKDTAGNWSKWSAARKIMILPPTPLAPALETPANAVVSNNRAPAFNWNAVDNGNTYRLEISESKTLPAECRPLSVQPAF